MRISDWSSDVCSSDLPLGEKDCCMSTQLVHLCNRASVLPRRTIRPFNAGPKRHFLRCSTIPHIVLRVPLSTTSIQKIELPDVPGPLHERLATAVEQLIGERR